MMTDSWTLGGGLAWAFESDMFRREHRNCKRSDAAPPSRHRLGYTARRSAGADCRLANRPGLRVTRHITIPSPARSGPGGPGERVSQPDRCSGADDSEL